MGAMWEVERGLGDGAGRATEHGGQQYEVWVGVSLWCGGVCGGNSFLRIVNTEPVVPRPPCSLAAGLSPPPPPWRHRCLPPPLPPYSSLPLLPPPAVYCSFLTWALGFCFVIYFLSFFKCCYLCLLFLVLYICLSLFLLYTPACAICFLNLFLIFWLTFFFWS